MARAAGPGMSGPGGRVPSQSFGRITMFNGATVTLAGYVATEPNFRMVNDDTTPIASMRVAWTARYRDRETGEWRDGATSFANVNCWRKLAGNAASSLRKGHGVMLTGRLEVREFEDREGRRRISVDIDADTIGHDLSRGVAHFQRTGGSPGGAGAGQRDELAAGESIRAGLTAETPLPGENGSGRDLAELPAGGEPPAQPTGDMFDDKAISELAKETEDAITAAAPF
jgi:single-strand DNA-binding protein